MQASDPPQRHVFCVADRRHSSHQVFQLSGCKGRAQQETGDGVCPYSRGGRPEQTRRQRRENMVSWPDHASCCVSRRTIGSGRRQRRTRAVHQSREVGVATTHVLPRFWRPTRPGTSIPRARPGTGKRRSASAVGRRAASATARRSARPDSADLPRRRSISGSGPVAPSFTSLANATPLIVALRRSATCRRSGAAVCGRLRSAMPSPADPAAAPCGGCSSEPSASILLSATSSDLS